ncbi:MAG TPA: RNA polymerase sigma factor [Thermodesulfovibrionia bacterium]|nr:RNA polymerase sigma factor [Thermodesulfovibrionia bacterium]
MIVTDSDSKLSALVKEAKDGSRKALEALAARFHKEVFRLVYCRVFSRHDAEDLTQEIFMQMVKSIQGLKEETRFKAWLYRIALNRVNDFFRQRERTDTEEPIEPDNDEAFFDHNNPELLLLRKEFWLRFNAFTTQLPRQEQEVFLLRFVEQMGIAEIASVLKKNESTVKTHLYRALKKFRQNTEFRMLLQGGL